MTRKHRYFAVLSLLLAILACNLPVEQIVAPGDVQTAAALTVQAVFLTPSLTGNESPSPAPKTPSVTSSPGLTMTVTPTYSVPMLTVQESTNCRTGPGESYEIVFTYTSGKKLEVVGRYDPGNFWLVKSNESPSGTCWMWGEYAEVTGSYWAVSSVTPPPTSTERPPLAATLLEWSYQCEGRTINFTVEWRDNANNETGYRLFRNEELLVELPANTTTYAEAYTPPQGQAATYAIQVYGPAGSASTYVGSMRCD
ncbi:MAG: SH3 domain-containing protein [Chloroflexi bacterium]|nr:MAG: SH3 domain-containing protein [Chloroflexota bacterium]